MPYSFLSPEDIAALQVTINNLTSAMTDLNYKILELNTSKEAVKELGRAKGYYESAVYKRKIINEYLKVKKKKR